MTISESPRHIVLIGYGNMGGAMLDGWLTLEKGFEFSVVKPSFTDRQYRGLKAKNVKAYTSAGQLSSPVDVFVLATKPNIIDTVCEEIAPLSHNSTAIVSVAAGRRVESIATYFPDKQPVIRVMPNTPSSVMRGAIGAYANAFARQDQKALIEALIRPLGYFTWVDEEDMIDAVTAISGSGPAYVFLFMEALRDAGKSLGLSDDIAQNLALQTIAGAAALAERDNNTPFEELRQNVTSPGGTTERGLAELLNDDALKRLVQKAADSAYARAKDIAG